MHDLAVGCLRSISSENAPTARQRAICGNFRRQKWIPWRFLGLVPRPCIESLGTQYEWPATQFSTARSRISVAANRKPFCARWQVSASSEHLAQVPGACLRSWQPARPPHTTRRKTQGEAKVQIWSWMMRQTSCFRSCQTPKAFGRGKGG